MRSSGGRFRRGELWVGDLRVAGVTAVDEGVVGFGFVWERVFMVLDLEGRPVFSASGAERSCEVVVLEGGSGPLPVLSGQC